MRKQNHSHTKHGLWSTDTLYRFGTRQEIQGITNPCWNEKNEIEHGLLVLECHHDAITPATTAPLSILDLFHQSGHPAIFAVEYRVPCPHEWSFEKDKQVEILCRDDKTCHGRAIAMSTRGVEVDLNDGVGVHLYPFYDIVKVFAIGDYVHDVDRWRDRFVQAVSDFHLTILMGLEDGNLQVTFALHSAEFSLILADRNSTAAKTVCRRATPPKKGTHSLTAATG